MIARIASPNQATPPMTIAVATDGSDHSARALGPARRLAGLIGAGLLEVAPGESLRDVAVGVRPVDTTVCFATRWFGRSGALQRVTEIGAPALCIGPRIQEPPWEPRDGVLVCLDGTPESERALAPAQRWAGLLNQPITLVTVAAETPPRADGQGNRFHFGPLDPDDYVGALADELRTSGAGVSTVVVTDRLSPASGLRQQLRRDRSALVVASTTSRTNVRAILLQSVAATIVENSRVPVLLVPPARLPTVV